MLDRISGAVSCYEIRWKLACQEQNYQVDGYLGTISCYKSGGNLLDWISGALSCYEIRWKLAGQKQDYPSKGYLVQFLAIKSSGNLAEYGSIVLKLGENWPDQNGIIRLLDIWCLSCPDPDHHLEVSGSA